MPTKKQLQEQIDLRKKQNQAIQEQVDREEILESTIKNRVKALDDIVKAENDVNKLTDIQGDLTSEVNRLLEIGHSAIVDTYEVEQSIVKN